MAKKKTTVTKTTLVDDSRMALGPRNYKLMLVGLGIIVLGFILMVGGGSDDPNVFNYGMFNFRRITLAPILVLGGFAFEVYAIMSKRRCKTEKAEDK